MQAKLTHLGNKRSTTPRSRDCFNWAQPVKLTRCSFPEVTEVIEFRTGWKLLQPLQIRSPGHPVTRSPVIGYWSFSTFHLRWLRIAVPFLLLHFQAIKKLSVAKWQRAQRGLFNQAASSIQKYPKSSKIYCKKHMPIISISSSTGLPLPSKVISAFGFSCAQGNPPFTIWRLPTRCTLGPTMDRW